ncbi:polynucleotide adenylyltransferase PcnB, partial [Achromobacter xylosoxidans]
RFSSDMREIWFKQPRFERGRGKTIIRRIDQPRFRPACDFLQLRAAAGQIDTLLAQWWMDLANADAATPADRSEEVSRLPRDASDRPAPSARKRRPRRRPSSRGAGSAPGSSGGAE